MPTMIESPLSRLSDDQIEELGREFDKIHDEVFAELGDRDRRYITSMIAMHRRLLVWSRVELLGSTNPFLWALGTTSLSLAKILENMEIGHNVMHGQWDWMNDPYIHSSSWDWDSASTPEAWKHSHNYVHHTYTNIRGKDKDLGYEIMRIDPHQKWYPFYLAQPFYNVLLAMFFEWGVAAHDLDLDAISRARRARSSSSASSRAWPQGPQPDRQGLHRLAAGQRGAAAAVKRLSGELTPPTRRTRIARTLKRRGRASAADRARDLALQAIADGAPTTARR
jgi:linoleoyl-CoA desaturase